MFKSKETRHQLEPSGEVLSSLLRLGHSYDRETKRRQYFSNCPQMPPTNVPGDFLGTITFSLGDKSPHYTFDSRRGEIFKWTTK